MRRIDLSCRLTETVAELVSSRFAFKATGPAPQRPRPNATGPKFLKLRMGGVGPRPSRHWGRPAVSMGSPRRHRGARNRTRVIRRARVIGPNVIRVAHVIGAAPVDLDLP